MYFIACCKCEVRTDAKVNAVIYIPYVTDIAASRLYRHSS